MDLGLRWIWGPPIKKIGIFVCLNLIMTDPELTVAEIMVEECNDNSKVVCQVRTQISAP